jgi:hypothetical protein
MMRASLGYKRIIINSVKIIDGQTTTVNFRLKKGTDINVESDGGPIKILPKGGSVPIKTRPQDDGVKTVNTKENEAKSENKPSKEYQSRNIKKDQTQTIYTIPAEEIEHTPKK